MRVTTLSLTLAAFVATALPAPAFAQEDGTFAIFIRGFRFGTIAYSGVENGGSYATASLVEASGLIGALVNARYDATSRGSVSGGRYVPARYDVTSKRGDRRTTATLTYSGGVPASNVQDPPRNARPSDIAPSAQGGTLDPSTAIYLALRDVSPDAACTLNFDMYDGRYRAKITILDPKPEGDGLVCSGAYERLAGYSDKEMSEGRRFPFTATYRPVEGGKLRLTQISMDTLYGRARVDRR